jgi:hypothetical protein
MSFTPWPLSSLGESPGTHWIGGWVGPRDHWIGGWVGPRDHWIGGWVGPRDRIGGWVGPRDHRIGGWVGPRDRLNDKEKLNFLILPGLELPPFGRPVRSQSLYRLRYRGSLFLFLIKY